MAIVVSDTSPIRALHHVGLIDLLPQMFGQIIVPPAVAAELQHPAGAGLPLIIHGQTGFQVVSAKNQNHVNDLLGVLDPGEAQAIVLAEELHADLLLIDERAGTRVARARNIATIGVLGLLARAKTEGRIASLHAVLHRLQAELDFWISPSLRERVLRSVHESP